VRLDGADLRWAPRKDIGRDRWHYDIQLDTALGEGAHEVAFELRSKKREGDAQLCSVEVLEFGTADECVRSLACTRLGLKGTQVQRDARRRRRVPDVRGRRARRGAPDGRGLPHAPGHDARLLRGVHGGAVGAPARARRPRRCGGRGVCARGARTEVQVRVRGEEGAGHWRADVRFASDQIRKDEEGVTRAGVQWVVDSGCA
jgi:hypothetical protein